MTRTATIEVRMRRTRKGSVGVGISAVLICSALIVAPWYTSFSTQRLMVEVFAVFAMAAAWNLLAGYGGLVVVGLQMFVGVGAYALFALSNKLELNPWLTLPLAGAATATFSAISLYPMSRLTGAHFAVGTWVLAEMLRIGTLNSEWLGAGAGMPLEALASFDRWTRNSGVYWAALAIGIGALVITRTIMRGKLGLALMSIRDSEAAAAASGVSIQHAKLALWIIAGTLTGLAGAVAYMNTLQVTPDASFSLNWSAAAIFIVVLGGIGTIEGPILGTLLYFVLRESFADYGAWYFIGLGLLAIAAMVFAPGGAWRLISNRWALDPFRVRRDMPSH